MRFEKKSEKSRWAGLLWVCFMSFLVPHMAGLDGGVDRSDMAEMVKKREQKLLLDFMVQNQGKLLDDADKVIEKYLQSTGGREAWEKINTLVLTYRLCDPNGGHQTVRKYYKRPSFFRQEMSGSQTVFVSNGLKTWKITGEQVLELKQSPFNRMCSIDDFFLDYKARGIRLQFKGVEILSATPVYRLTRSFLDGYSEDLFFSVQSGLLSEKLTPYIMGISSYMSFWDFRKIDNVLLPHVFIRSSADNGPPHGGVLVDAQVNPLLDDALFGGKKEES